METENSSLVNQESVFKRKLSMSWGGFLFLMTLMYVVWFFYVMSLKDLPAEIVQATGAVKIISILGLSSLYVALSPFAGFPYHGDTLSMILYR